MNWIIIIEAETAPINNILWFRMKKFGLFGDNDLFFARKIKPLADETKMRRFQGSRVLAGCVILTAAFIPYWYLWSNIGSIQTTITSKLSFSTISSSRNPTHRRNKVARNQIRLHEVALLSIYALFLYVGFIKSAKDHKFMEFILIYIYLHKIFQYGKQERT